ncbi:diaminopimelate decarboxylase [Actinopolymorpha pittospori]|uniref:Diaminopimelate decarboxylase n=1 Tax=Actinopolymorpha pittospori TaxID=648752 RepID=A0A927N189_9ACTN|nr:diaminopimelate decarboxylase [Actinopolymorpha pittospori]MBE1610421.1 diaminopimelate decarboxylase [Actinopolymorpha pittospori]
MTTTVPPEARITGPSPRRLGSPWPLTARQGVGGDLVVGGVSLVELAGRYGTPTYVVDEVDVRTRCRTFRGAFPDVEVAYAGKAFLSRAMATWMAEEGMSLDLCSAGEVGVAESVGFPAERTILHGNAKTVADLEVALSYGVGRIVLDSASEVARVSVLAQRPQRVLIRVIPGVDAHTHPAIATGSEDQKFGLRPGGVREAVRRVLEQPQLVYAGLHCHIGSQVGDPSDFLLAARRVLELARALRDELGVETTDLDLGGGYPVPYVVGDIAFDVAPFADQLRRTVQDTCARLRLPVPRLTIEPGRAIAARAGVTLYRVVSVKRSAGGRTFVAVDGGFGDNPRAEMYGARYTVRSVGRPASSRHEIVTIVGRYCEAGDVLAEDILLPADIHPGDLLAVACTGAYHHSMASSYNLVPRPPVVAVRDETSRLLVRRETDVDMRCRDVGL